MRQRIRRLVHYGSAEGARIASLEQPIVMMSWLEHDRRSVARLGALLVAVIATVFGLLFLMTMSVVFPALAVFFVALALFVTLWNPEGWNGCWSMRVILPGNRARALIVRKIEERGAQVAVVDAPERQKYFRTFENPIDVSGQARIWTKSWEQTSGRGTPHVLTIIVVEPIPRERKLGELLALISEVLKEAATQYYQGALGPSAA